MSAGASPPNFSIIQSGSAWVNKDGTPTPYFFRLISNMFNSAGSGSPPNLTELTKTLFSESSSTHIARLEKRIADLERLLLQRPPRGERVKGIYSTTFQTGYVQYTGPGSTLAANVNFQFGTDLPNPSGTPGPALLLGSGGGAGVHANAWIISDQAVDNVTPGNTLGITSGSTTASGTANGGLLFIVGGASFGGTGGANLLQGGTSMNGPGGTATLSGGNSANGIPGDAFVTGGQTGTQGANVHLIMTSVAGTAGVVRIRVNSTSLFDFQKDGELYIYSAASVGLAGQALVSGGPGASMTWATGFSGTITTAKLTSGGANGSMTFVQGILTAETAAT